MLSLDIHHIFNCIHPHKFFTPHPHKSLRHKHHHLLQCHASNNHYQGILPTTSFYHSDNDDSIDNQSSPDQHTTNNTNPTTNPPSLDSDTIAAIVTGASQGSISIIRLSGPTAISIAAQIFLPSTTTQSPISWNPQSHRIYHGHAIDPREQHIHIDEVLAFCMKGPRSYTAEDVVEIHTHGGTICARRVLQACIVAGARLAKPGEFTMRAFLNGRLDLSQAESVAQLLEARTVAAADSALAGLSGGLGQEISNVRRACLDVLVELDARLDFDEDLPPLDTEHLIHTLNNASLRVDAAMATARQGQLLRTGLQIALIGQPNVGKSSLLNALSGTDRAIVTEIAGTTRDVVEAGLVVGGIPVTLLDTAGLRDAHDVVEKIGVERSVAAARQADMVVMVVDGERGWNDDDEGILQRVVGSSNINSSDDGDSDDDNISDSNTSSSRVKMPPSVLVINKADLISTTNNSSDTIANNIIPMHIQQLFSRVVLTSASTGHGLDDLQDALLHVAGAPDIVSGGISWAINERQAEALTRASEALERARTSVMNELPIDFWTIDLRSAVLALGEVSGEEITEEVLDSIFSKFCIGK